jgi:hypothetical protein
MKNESHSLTHLTDAQLLTETRMLAERERKVTAKLIASLGELDARRLYLGEGYSSLFTYCTQRLLLSEHAAYGRIQAARAARRFPILLDYLRDGSITLTTISLLAPHLTSENHRSLLDNARHKTKREVEQQVATLRPLPPVPSTVRQLASALSPGWYQVQFTIPDETYWKLRRVQELLRHSLPNGDPAVILDRALTSLLTSLQKSKLGLTDRPRASRQLKCGSRRVPAAVKREVWKRDGGQCAFVGKAGRCAERGFLEFHHVIPFADGGRSTSDNLQLRCHAHNAYEADRWSGRFG